MIGDLSGETVLVTGARGFLGRPICAYLLQAGARLITVDLTESTDLERMMMAQCWSINRDVECLFGVQLLAGTIEEQWGVPDGLLLLHGLDFKPGEEDDDDPWRSWDEMISVNLTGVKNVCQVFGQKMADAGRGSIICIGSLYGSHAPDQRLYSEGFTKGAAYSASKGGVLGLTRWMAAYWADKGVRVNCVSPGGIGSDTTPPDFRARFEARVPMGRMGRPEDLVGVISWLLSDDSAYVTGQEICVNGGVGLWP